MFSFAGCDSKKADHDRAEALMVGGEYFDAKEAFLILGEYDDSAEKAEERENLISYETASALMEEEKYEKALIAFTELGHFKDSGLMPPYRELRS